MKNNSNVLNNSKIEDIRENLIQNESILFALLFGSSVSGNMHDLSDIDIGIYFKQDISALEIGKIIAELEKLTRNKIDIVELNELYKKNPLLAFEITSHNKKLFVRNEDIYIQFKKQVILNYLDTNELRKMVRDSLSKRIDTHTFGKFNHA